MKDKLSLCSVFINNNKMRFVKNTELKTTQTSVLHVNGHAMASQKDNWFLKILKFLIFKT